MTCVPAGDEEVTQWMWYANGGLVAGVATQSVAFTFNQGETDGFIYNCAMTDETGTSDMRFVTRTGFLISSRTPAAGLQ